jgi:hypothetical protein
MKKFFPLFIAVVAFTLGVTLTTAFAKPQQNMGTEASEHPRIAKAISQMEDALDYLEHAPHDFGGHKAQAMADTKAAIKSLKMCLAYRAAQDNKK